MKPKSRMLFNVVVVMAMAVMPVTLYNPLPIDNSNLALKRFYGIPDRWLRAAIM